MFALERARQYLESLGLKQVVEVLDNTLDSADSKQLTYPETLAQLLGAEVEARGHYSAPEPSWLACLPAHSGAIRARLSALHRRAPEPAPVNVGVKELSGLAFVSGATNIFILGPAWWADAHGGGPCQESQRMGLLAPKVLVVDEFGIWPFDRDPATVFFTL